MLRRLIFVFRMMCVTMVYWGPLNWCGFWLGKRNFVSLKGLELKVRDGRYYSKIADLAMAWEVAIDEVYDYFPIFPDDIILDIGGHIGSFSKRASAMAPNGVVHTCEPFPPTFNLLSQNVSTQANVNVHQIAISNRDGEDTFYFSPDNPAENSLVRETEHSMQVPLLTLKTFMDSIDLKSVDLMKIDCEGAEYDLIFAAGDCLDRVQKMVMEVHEPKYFGLADKYSIDGLVDFLEKIGFQVVFERENKFQGYIYAHRVG